MMSSPHRRYCVPLLGRYDGAAAWSRLSVAVVAVSKACRARKSALNACGGLCCACCFSAFRTNWRSNWMSACGYVSRSASKQRSPSVRRRLRQVSTRWRVALCKRSCDLLASRAAAIAINASSGSRRSCFAKNASSRLRAMAERICAAWLRWMRNSGLSGRLAHCPGLSSAKRWLNFRILSACRRCWLRLGGLVDCESWVIAAQNQLTVGGLFAAAFVTSDPLIG